MLIADLHIHSKYSLATSKDCEPETLDLWARRKGIGLVGTGDFTHPAWRAELREKLVPAEDGLYRLRPGAGIEDPAASGEAPPFCGHRRDQHHLQEKRQDPQGTQPDSAAGA